MSKSTAPVTVSDPFIVAFPEETRVTGAKNPPSTWRLPTTRAFPLKVVVAAVEKVLVSASNVEDAAVMVMFEAPVNATPLIVLPGERTEADPASPDQVPEVSSVRTELDPPTFTTACESERGDDAVRVVVATSPSFAGVPEVVVQYASCPDVSLVEVETDCAEPLPHPVQVPEMVMLLV